jgi:hypothetical protein
VAQGGRSDLKPDTGSQNLHRLRLKRESEEILNFFDFESKIHSDPTSFAHEVPVPYRYHFLYTASRY